MKHHAPSSLAALRAAFVLILCALLAACGGSPTPAFPTPPPLNPDEGAGVLPTVAGAAPQATAADAAGAAGADLPLTGAGQVFDVDIADSQFNPTELTIPAGATVVWTHRGQAPHTVTADEGAFESETIQSGGIFEFSFLEPGIYAYHCAFHGGPGGEGMSGVIVVEAAAPPPAAEAPDAPTGAAPEPTAAGAAVEPPPAGEASVTMIGPLNRDASQAALSPGLAVGATTAGAQPNLWVSWAENSPGGARQIFAGEVVDNALQLRGASLNIHINVVGEAPTLAFAGENRLVPWVAWAEPSPGFGDVSQIFASRFNAASGLWQQAGQDRGGGEATLNLHTNREAARPFIFAGSGDPTQPPVPWVAWEELSSLSSFSQIFVAHGVKDETAIGGFRWEMVGQITNNGEPSLNVGHFRHGLRATAAFAGQDNSVPWVTWHESGGDQPERVFAARGTADPAAPGGFRWVTVPECAPDETACALNINPLRDAKDASTAAGTLTAGQDTVPWVAWAELGPSGKWQIVVSRLDPATRSSFLQVGGSLNVDQNLDARAPAIAFVGNIPYVAWLEDDGTGRFAVHVRHLSGGIQDAAWVLDTPPGGVSANPGLSSFDLAAAGSADTLFLSWTEGDPTQGSSQVVVGSLKP
jgi:plastocyanin